MSKAKAQGPAPTRSRGTKDAHDKFYTKPEVAAACIARLDLAQFARIIEPSAGSGAFSDHLFAARGSDVLAFDLVPENKRVKQQDWFEFEETASGMTLVVGNPPFGRQSSLALRFIDHAFDVVGADTVAFVLPRGFLKESVQEKVFAFARLADEVVLPPESFTLHGRAYSLPTVFQVWERATTKRPALSGSNESLFVDFRRLPAPFDFAVRRVGGSAGRAYQKNKMQTASPETNYFLKLRRKADGVPRGLRVQDVVELVNDTSFPEASNSTGPKSLSKREFVRHFDAAFASKYINKTKDTPA